MERVCERVIVIAQGRILLDQPLASLRQSYIKKKRVILQLASADFALSLPGVREMSRGAHRLELELETDLTPIETLIARVLERGQLRDLTIEDPPLDEIVRAIYQRATEGLSAPRSEAS
jgi:ABC-2 type transport system ATP-binding protein